MAQGDREMGRLNGVSELPSGLLVSFRETVLKNGA
jgi:hypothetical protein